MVVPCQWQHSSSADNSWIKAKQVLHCEELIQEFLETEANRRGGSQAKLKTTAKKSTAGGAVKTKRK